MVSLFNFGALLSVRLLSVVSFFLISTVLSSADFRDYAFYFSAWQIAAQFICLQLGVAFFRFGNSGEYSISISTVVSFIVKAAVPIYMLMVFVVVVADFGLYAICVAMTLIYSVFIAVAEYARTQIKESIVFLSYGASGLAGVVVFLLNKYIGVQFLLRDIFILEAFSYLVVTVFLVCSMSVKKFTVREFYDAAKIFYPLWQKISLPLIPSNMIWYAYFNAPQLVLYFITPSPDSYNNGALLMRVIVALSTLASIAALSFQKETVLKFDSCTDAYVNYRSFILFKFFPAASVLIVLMSALLGYIGVEKFVNYDYFFNYLLDVRVLVSIVFCLFVLNYGSAQFLIAEKNTLAAAKTMYLGFVLYLSAVFVLLNVNVDASVVSIYAMALGLSATFILRIFILLGAKNA